MVTRINTGLIKQKTKAQRTSENTGKFSGKITVQEILIALICCIADFCIAQFGLLTLIQKAYSALAYLAIPVILIPYVIHMIVTRFDSKK